MGKLTKRQQRCLSEAFYFYQTGGLLLSFNGVRGWFRTGNLRYHVSSPSSCLRSLADKGLLEIRCGRVRTNRHEYRITDAGISQIEETE